MAAAAASRDLSAAVVNASTTAGVPTTTHGFFQTFHTTAQQQHAEVGFSLDSRSADMEQKNQNWLF